jgi:hypothetical protein
MELKRAEKDGHTKNIDIEMYSEERNVHSKVRLRLVFYEKLRKPE